jgi:hypothetical protein
MPYILAFWRDADDERRNPGRVYDALCDSKAVDGLATLPITDMQQRLRDVFDPILPRSDPYAWEGADGVDMFLVESGPQHLFVVAGHSTSTDHYNTMIDIMKEFGCPLFDPQTNMRYLL